MWTYKDETSTEGYYNYNNLYNVDADLCLDLTGGNTSPRMPVNLYHCTPRNNQLWIPPCSINKDKHDCTGGIKLLETPNRCLDADSPIKPSNQVILVGCDETLQAQQWTMIWTGVKDAKSGDYIFISLWILLPRNLKVLVLPKSQASSQVKRKEVLKGKPFRVVNSFV
jgi:hypothetical protein